LVDQHCFDKGLVIAFGPSGHMKTFWANHMAFSLVTGLPFLGLWEVKRRPVSYIISEGFQGLKWRFQSWRRHYQLDYPPISVIDQCFDLHNVQIVKDLVKQECDYHGEMPAFFIDPASHNFGGRDTLNQEDVRHLCHNLLVYMPTMVLVVHHTGWDAEHERGASSWRDNATTSIRIRKEEEKSPPTVTCRKQRYAEEFKPYYTALKQEGKSVVMVAQELDADLLNFISQFPTKGYGKSLEEACEFLWVSEKQWGRTQVQKMIKKGEARILPPRLKHMSGTGKRNDPQRYIQY
jgi:hypothetical protein